MTTAIATTRSAADPVVAGSAVASRPGGSRHGRGAGQLGICPSIASTPGHVSGRETGANLGEDASSGSRHDGKDAGRWPRRRNPAPCQGGGRGFKSRQDRQRFRRPERHFRSLIVMDSGVVGPHLLLNAVDSHGTSVRDDPLWPRVAERHAHGHDGVGVVTLHRLECHVAMRGSAGSALGPSRDDPRSSRSADEPRGRLHGRKESPLPEGRTTRPNSWVEMSSSDVSSSSTPPSTTEGSAGKRVGTESAMSDTLRPHPSFRSTLKHDGREESTPRCRRFA